MAEPKRLTPSRLNRRAAVPLLVALNLASQLQSDQQRERQEDATTEDIAEGVTDPTEPVFLEQESRSYTHPKKTAQDTWAETQRGMTRTAAQLSGAGTPSTRTPSPESSASSRESPSRGRAGQQATGSGTEVAAQETQDAQQDATAFEYLRRLQAQQQETERRDVQDVTLDRGKSLLQNTKKEFQDIRQFAEGISGVGLLALLVELNVQTAATLLHRDIPYLGKASRPRMLITGFVDCNCCMSQFWFLLLFIIPALIVWWLIENPLIAFWLFLTS